MGPKRTKVYGLRASRWCRHAGNSSPDWVYDNWKGTHKHQRSQTMKERAKEENKGQSHCRHLGRRKASNVGIKNERYKTQILWNPVKQQTKSDSFKQCQMVKLTGEDLMRRNRQKFDKKQIKEKKMHNKSDKLNSACPDDGKRTSDSWLSFFWKETQTMLKCSRMPNESSSFENKTKVLVKCTSGGEKINTLDLRQRIKFKKSE